MNFFDKKYVIQVVLSIDKKLKLEYTTFGLLLKVDLMWCNGTTGMSPYHTKRKFSPSRPFDATVNL